MGFGSGTALADSLVGMTYSEASAQIAQRGEKPVIATVTGEALDTSECIVASTQRITMRDPSGRDVGTKVLVNLNCKAGLAEPGSPGISAATQEGRDEKKLNDQAEMISENYVEMCGDGPEQWLECKAVCDKTGKCEVS